MPEVDRSRLRTVATIILATVWSASLGALGAWFVASRRDHLCSSDLLQWLAAVTELVKVLAWPSIALLILIIFRSAIVAAIPDLEEVRIGKLRLKFSRGLGASLALASGMKATEEALKAAGLPAESAPGPQPSDPAPPPAPSTVREDAERVADNQLALRAAVYPKGLVMESWSQIEEATRSALTRLGVTVTRAGVAGQLAALQQASPIPANVVELIANLRDLRNEAAHYPESVITSQDALTYARLTRTVVLALQDVGRDASEGAE